MAKTLLAVLLVLAGNYLLPDLGHWRGFTWLKRWLARSFNAASGENSYSTSAALILPIILVALCALLQWVLADRWFGLLGFAFALMALFLCWGASDLEAD